MVQHTDDQPECEDAVREGQAIKVRPYQEDTSSILIGTQRVGGPLQVAKRVINDHGVGRTIAVVHAVAPKTTAEVSQPVSVARTFDQRPDDARFRPLFVVSVAPKLAVVEPSLV